jgi:hypothetical protein
MQKGTWWRSASRTTGLVTYGGAAFFTVLNGQLKEVWIVEDNLSLMQQIGMELVPNAS